MRSQLVLDHALRALGTCRNAGLHAAVTAEIPTLQSLCAALDVYAVPVPNGVVGHVCGWRDNPAAPIAHSVPQDLPTTARPAT